MPDRFHTRKHVRFVDLPRHKRRSAVVRLGWQIARRADGAGFWTDHLLEDPGEPNRIQRWVDVNFLGADRFTLWNAEFITTQMAWEDAVHARAFSETDALLSAEESETEFKWEWKSVPLKSPGGLRAKELVQRPDRHYACALSASISTASFWLLLVAICPPMVWRSYRYCGPCHYTTLTRRYCDMQLRIRDEKMTKAKPSKRQKRALNTLLEKGILASGLGIVFLATPLFLKSSGILSAVAGGLRVPGWLALGIGMALIGIHHVTKAKVEAATAFPTTPAKPLKRQPWGKPEAWGKNAPVDTIEDVSGEHLLKRIAATSSRTEPTFSISPAPPPKVWSPAVFAAIEWRRFEAVCEALFAQAGFQTRSQSHGADGGVDIWLHSANALGPVSVVQCKHWQGKPVGVKEMREFFGVMSSHQLKRGTYATTSTYTADAQQFAKANAIHTLDGSALLALIAKRTPEQQRALLAVAFEGEYWCPTCASCGTKMIERMPAKGGAAFWGCSNYPRSKATFKMTVPM